MANHEEQPRDEPLSEGLPDDLLEAVGEYNAETIKVLQGLEAVRKRPAMYIGDTTVRGLHHLVYEVVDNSVDEAMGGFCDEIVVRLQPDGSCSVLDNGRGIPVDEHAELGIPAVEVVLTTLHAGGKFDHKSYKVSGGLHGVGVSCVNALAEWLEVEVYRDGHIHFQDFERGARRSQLERRGLTEKVGTRISFKPDPEIFDTGEFRFDILANRLRELAFLNRGLCIRLIDERGDTERFEEFLFEGGIEAFVQHLNTNREALHDVVYVEGEADGVMMEAALQYTQSTARNIFSFANNINTRDGGTHLSGFKTALTTSFNSFIRAENLSKKSQDLPSGDDYLEGLTAVLSVKVPDPQFEGQTKTKLGNREVQGLVTQLVNRALSVFLEENGNIGRVICQKAMLSRAAREAARKARELTMRKGVLSGSNLPGKLADCISRDTKQTEIYLVEGDSAGGTAKQGRDRTHQAILPLRGKILNVEKAGLEKLLKHEEIKTVIRALGTGINEDFDSERLRYGKVIIMTDADVDGSHIRTLLLTFFFRYFPQLVESGMVYIAQPPLYRIKRKRKTRYVHDERQMTQELLSLGMDGALLTLPTEGAPALWEVKEEALESLVELLLQLEDQARLVERKGIAFHQYLALRNTEGHFPVGRVRSSTGEQCFYYNEQERLAFLEQTTPEGEEEPTIYHEGDYEIPWKRKTAFFFVEVRFHNERRLQELVGQLEERGVQLEQYLEPRPGGEARFLLKGEGEEYPLETLRDALDALRKLGKKGIDLQRYKGLGEMNADQLWDTTMNPETRTLVRVKLEDVIAADQMFTILMGVGVGPRREYIERHALEVKDLDI